jgi:hypothetical protein
VGGDGNQEALEIRQEAIKEEPPRLQAPTAATGRWWRQALAQPENREDG